MRSEGSTSASSALTSDSSSCSSAACSAHESSNWTSAPYWRNSETRATSATCTAASRGVRRVTAQRSLSGAPLCSSSASVSASRFGMRMHSISGSSRLSGLAASSRRTADERRATTATLSGVRVPPTRALTCVGSRSSGRTRRKSNSFDGFSSSSINAEEELKCDCISVVEFSSFTSHRHVLLSQGVVVSQSRTSWTRSRRRTSRRVASPAPK